MTRISGLGQLSGIDNLDSSSSAPLFEGAGLVGTTSTTPLRSTSMLIIFAFRYVLISKLRYNMSVDIKRIENNLKITILSLN